jgi:hypothetical protein
MSVLRAALAASTIAGAAFLATEAHAQVVNYAPLFPGLFPTGFNSSGDTIAVAAPTSTSEGTLDGHYSVVAVSTFVTGYTAFEGTAVVTDTAKTWHSPVDNSEWVEPPGGTFSSAGGNPEYYFPSTGSVAPSGVQYDYQIVFTVPTSYALSTLTIAGSLAADDYVDIYLNGQTSREDDLTSAGLFSSGAAFSLTTANGLVAGANTLTFAVFNLDTGSKTTSPSGLDVFAIGSGTYTTLGAPEVGAFLPVAVAVALYGGVLVARRRSRVKAGRGPN